jgi:hypothetical protein
MAAAERLATFLGEPFDRAKAAAGVAPELRRQWQKSSSIEIAGETACATNLDQQFTKQGITRA